MKTAGRIIWRLDHAGKDPSRGQRGTSAKSDDVDLVWQLKAREGGIRLQVTHRRQSWVPEVVDLDRLEDPLRHERATETWPPGTVELAAVLDELDIPLDLGVKLVRQALRERGRAGARNEVMSAAQKYRRQQRSSAGSTGGNTSSAGAENAGGEQPGTGSPATGERAGERPGTSSAATGEQGGSPYGEPLSQAGLVAEEEAEWTR